METTKPMLISTSALIPIISLLFSFFFLTFLSAHVSEVSIFQHFMKSCLRCDDVTVMQ